MRRFLPLGFILVSLLNLGAASDYVRQTTWATNDLITASKLNADPDETQRILGSNSNGILANGNISATAAIVESKISFSTAGHSHNGSNSTWVADGQQTLSHVTSALWNVGNGVNENIRFRAINGDANPPEIRYQASGNVWQFSNDGSTFTTIDTTLTTQAVQADIEAETDQNTYIPPDLIKKSPGIAKGWCFITSTGGLSSPSYNVDSITDTGTGDRTVVWGTDFSSTVYSFVGMGTDDGTANVNANTFAVGSVRHTSRGPDTPWSLSDNSSAVAAFGDQ